jgi:histidinol-phosphate aminotransferase
LASKKIDLPPGVLEPREAVLKMAPYSPPTGGRADKLRLDFNENTVGVSPKVLEYLREHLTEAGVAMYPEYGEIKQELAEFFGVETDDFILTNGTDEAIQVLINTYVDDGNEVLLLKPSYAMYRFYAEVAGASIREVSYRKEKLAFPLDELIEAIGPSTRAILIANPNNPTGTGTSRAGIERILVQASGADRRGLFRILRRHRAASLERLSESVREPYVFEGVWDGSDASGLSVFAIGQCRLFA